jgi:uncharacterized protein (DUF1778 family)
MPKTKRQRTVQAKVSRKEWRAIAGAAVTADKTISSFLRDLALNDDGVKQEMLRLQERGDNG